MSGEDRLRDHPEWIINRQGTDMVLYKGLLHLAHTDGLKSIRTAIVQCPSELNGSTAIVHAEVETARGVFEGIGDANPTNVNRMIVAHLIRMAETRAKARALRDALDIGFVAAEELGGDAGGDEAAPEPSQPRGNAAPRPAAARDGEWPNSAPQSAPAAQNATRGDEPVGTVRFSECRSCGETIAFKKVPSGKWAVLNVDGDKQPTTVSHFSTCPKADAWKDGKRPAGVQA